MEKPFLDDKFQISWSDLKPKYIVSDITEAIENAQKRIDSLSKTDFPEEGLTFENTLIALESAYEFLSGPRGLVSHLDSVSNWWKWACGQWCRRHVYCGHSYLSSDSGFDMDAY